MDEHATSAARGAAVVDGATAAAALRYQFMPLDYGDFVKLPGLQSSFYAIYSEADI